MAGTSAHMTADGVGANRGVDFGLPRRLRDNFETSARHWLATPLAERRVVPPRLSASVLLLRDDEDVPAIEVFMQHRRASMAFAPGVWVYPGGGVDPGDADIESEIATAPETGTLPDVGVDAAQAHLMVCAAAAREVFEECGVLFAGRGADHLHTDASDPHWETRRAAVLGRSMSFAQMLRQESLVLRADLLTPVARWITPEYEPRRYDTFFFAARMPAGQQADGRTTEAYSSRWSTAAAALQQHRAGPGTLMPPTQVLAEQMARAHTVGDFLREPRSLVPVLPQPVDLGDRLVMRAPIDAHGHALPVDRASPAGGD